MDKDLPALYRGPLDGFMARRAELAGRLKAEDPAAAAAVKALRKPSVIAWAVDQLAVENAGVVLELLAAGADAATAQAAASSGASVADSLRQASLRLRQAVEEAVRAASAVLEAAGHGAGDDAQRRLRTTLQAAATGAPEGRAALWRGTLDREVTAAGFHDEAAAADPPELSAALATLCRKGPAGPGAPARTAPPRPAPEAIRAAEKELAQRERLAAHGRETATQKRVEAERTATLAAQAAADAERAETAAARAERNAAAARAALDAARSGASARHHRDTSAS